MQKLVKNVQIGGLTLSNNIFLAPMAGITDIPFRLLVKGMGAGLLYSEMISVEGLIRSGKKTLEYIMVEPEERPVALQLFGNKPESIERAVHMVNDRADVIALNCGCSVNKVLKASSGAFLLKDLLHLEKIMRVMKKAATVPVTIKIRSGWDKDKMNAVEVAKAAENCGFSALAIHPRFKTQLFSGSADWSVIEKVKKSVKIPVIGSGDVKNGKDAERMLKETGCDAIMIGRACMGNPWVFGEILNYLEGKEAHKPSFAERAILIRRHAVLMIKYKGERRGLREFRKQLHYYLKGSVGLKNVREKINTMETLTQFLVIMQEMEGVNN